MTLDELKQFANEMIDAAQGKGDSLAGETRAAIVIAVVNHAGRVLMPSDLEQMRKAEQAFSVTTGPLQRGGSAIPRIG